MKVAILILALGLVVLLVSVVRNRSRANEPVEHSGLRRVLEGPDWINVRLGSPSEVQRAVESYSELSEHLECREVMAEITKIQDGTVGVTFSEHIPPYAFLNLMGWLNGPPDVEGVTSATGWYSSPSSGIRYAFWPDESNPQGDTLIGVSSEGERVSVYQPDLSFCRRSQPVDQPSEPTLESTKDSIRMKFLVPVEVMENFGNPALEFTHVPDTPWN